MKCKLTAGVLDCLSCDLRLVACPPGGGHGGRPFRCDGPKSNKGRQQQDLHDSKVTDTEILCSGRVVEDLNRKCKCVEIENDRQRESECVTPHAMQMKGAPGKNDNDRGVHRGHGHFLRKEQMVELRESNGKVCSQAEAQKPHYQSRG